MRRASLFFSPKVEVVSARYATPLYQVQRAAFSFKGVTGACPRVFYNTRFMSWKWLLAGVAIPSIAWAFYSHTANHQSVPFATGSNELPFSQDQVKAAATWWAQFLKPNTTFSEINKNTGIKNRTFEAVVQIGLDHNHQITDEQIQRFIEILSAKMQVQKLQTGFDLPYVQIGHRSSYGPPKIVEESLAEANIYGLFPFKTEMRIYSNGPVMVNDKCIYTDPSFTHYDDNISFEESTTMAISGYKFREITIPASRAQGLWEGFKGHWSRFDQKNLSRECLEEGNEGLYVYTTVRLDRFKGSEADFLKLSNEDWIRILSTWSEFKKYFDEEKSHIYYETSPRLETSFFHLGPVTRQLVEKNRPDYYEYTTGPVRVLSAPKAGTIGKYSLQPVSVGDLIFKRDSQPERGAVYFLPSSLRENSFFLAKPLSPQVNNSSVEQGKDDAPACRFKSFGCGYFRTTTFS